MEQFIELIETLAHQQGCTYHLLSFILSSVLVVVMGIRGYKIATGKASIGSLFKNLTNNRDFDELKAQIEQLLQDQDSSDNKNQDSPTSNAQISSGSGLKAEAKVKQSNSSGSKPKTEAKVKQPQDSSGSGLKAQVEQLLQQNKDSSGDD